MANDCRTCKHNSYYGVTNEWLSCSHPITLAKQPKWEEGDPEFVNFRTADVPAGWADMLANCAKWERHE